MCVLEEKKPDALLFPKVVAVVVPEGLAVALEEAEASVVVEGVAVTPEGSEVEAVSVVEEAETL